MLIIVAVVVFILAVCGYLLRTVLDKGASLCTREMAAVLLALIICADPYSHIAALDAELAFDQPIEPMR